VGRVLAVLVGLMVVLTAPTVSEAQEPERGVSECLVEAVADLPRCVDVGEELVLTTAEHREVSGQFLGYADGAVILKVGGELAFGSFSDAEVQEISVMRPERRGERVTERVGSSIAVGLLLVWAGAGSSTQERAALIAGLAALGGLVEWFVPGDVPRVVLQRGEPREMSALPVPPRDAPVFASTVSTLAPRLMPGDRLRVRQFNGTMVLGQYDGIEDGALLVRTGSPIRRVPQGDIRSVERLTRQRPSMKKAAVIGAIVCMGLVWIGSTVDEHTNPAEPLTVGTMVGGAVLGAGTGAGLSLVLGGRRAELVFYRPEARAVGPLPSAAVSWTVGF